MVRQRSHISDYLWNRPNSSSIWFSRAVPKAAQQIEGKKLIQFSLRTTDRVQARALARKHAVEQDQRWGLMHANDSAPTPADPNLAVLQVAVYSLLEKMEARQRAIPSDDHAAHNAELERSQAEMRMLSRRLMNGEMGDWEALAERMVRNPERNLGLRPGSDPFNQFVQALAVASIDAIGVHTRRLAGDLTAEPQSEIAKKARVAAASRAKTGETIIELFERWAADRLAKKEKRPDTVNQDRKVIQQFAEFVGKDRAIASITPIEVAEYRDVLRDLPPKWRASSQLKGLGIREAVAKARELELRKTAFTSVNKHLSTISPLYKWLRAQPAWAGLANPCDGLHHTRVKGKNRRPSFSTATLNKMLHSPLFAGFLADDREHVRGSVRADDWRYWIPLICLFTGARIGEIAQLCIGDVRQEHGVWFIHIRHEEGKGLTTKSGQSRPAAVHPILEKIGFLAFHERQTERFKRSENARLFPELQPNNRGQISGEPSRWWRDYLAAIGIKDAAKEGGDGIGAHSFRHTLSDRLRVEAELLDSQIGIILGHSQPSTTAGYGALPQGTVNMLSGWMKAVRFDGVNFSHLVVHT